MLKWLAFAALGLWGLNALRTKAAANGLTLDVSNAKFKYIPPTKGQITLTLTAKNQSNQELTITQPALRLYYNGTQFASSTPSAALITIPANAQANFDVDLTTENAGLIQVIAGLISGGVGVVQLKLNVKTTANGIPVEEDFNIDFPIS